MYSKEDISVYAWVLGVWLYFLLSSSVVLDGPFLIVGQGYIPTPVNRFVTKIVKQVSTLHSSPFFFSFSFLRTISTRLLSCVKYCRV